MKQLRDKVAEKTNVKQSSDYINDSTEHQRGYDQALQEAENIINEIGNPTLNKSEIEQKLQQLTDAQNALQGSHLLEEAKNNAITGINKLTALNDAQRQKAIENVQAQQTIPAVNQQLTLDREINTAMQALRDKVGQQITFTNKVIISMKMNNQNITMIILYKPVKLLLINFKINHEQK